MLSIEDKKKLEILGCKFKASKAPYHMMIDSLLSPDTTLLYMACLHDDGHITEDERSLLDWFKRFSVQSAELSLSDQREMINAAFHGYYSYRYQGQKTKAVSLEAAEVESNQSSVA
ncbi:hypothetical protein PN466_13605 [Roseofilum reptotaenium CS-1145]|uniref:Uncharacterized protein n=1 Tax=Roseofilum reptotaenium AO1-A TaxID=1925591 RepID=A0A1L9QWE8_9CYAN|nr:hypothetical protein [Roseofilum reptotaenium]MDB9517985.1 hypothetical protein [Roseofilum reptotaenium CS-1145]OJJ26927.1 hypothetical protein BI308_04355 [Roseofilum reptotaenium AO1-A]